MLKGDVLNFEHVGSYGGKISIVDGRNLLDLKIFCPIISL